MPPMTRRRCCAAPSSVILVFHTVTGLFLPSPVTYFEHCKSQICLSSLTILRPFPLLGSACAGIPLPPSFHLPPPSWHPQVFIQPKAAGAWGPVLPWAAQVWRIFPSPYLCMEWPILWPKVLVPVPSSCLLWAYVHAYDGVRADAVTCNAKGLQVMLHHAGGLRRCYLGCRFSRCNAYSNQAISLWCLR